MPGVWIDDGTLPSNGQQPFYALSTVITAVPNLPPLSSSPSLPLACSLGGDGDKRRSTPLHLE